MIRPDYLFESSWEVCNKMGGIYTVLASKARTLTDDFHDNIIFIGPDLNTVPDDFEEDASMFEVWKASLPKDLKVRTGRWRVPGKPIAMLVAYKTFYDRRDALYYEIWESFKVDSSHAYGDYDESCIFAYSVALVIESFYRFHRLETKHVAALFNEWMLCMGALYLQKKVPRIATLFTTHATTTGRSIAGHDKPLHSCLHHFVGDQMARELNVEAKHSLEKQTAHYIDCFTTVSEITAIECRQLLDRAPDVVTPNGFEREIVPPAEQYSAKRAAARATLIRTVEKLTRYAVAEDAFLVATSGRYEYRNKGIDVFLDTMNELRTNTGLKRQVVAFIMIPADVHDVRADLKYLLANDTVPAKGLQTPFLTHWLKDMSHDRVMSRILSTGFTNTPKDNVRIVFVPCYLDSYDGIFNLSYYDLLIGLDATVFASYYEPWGYTPLESVAFGIPTITTDLAGFGIWAQSQTALTDDDEVVDAADDDAVTLYGAAAANPSDEANLSDEAANPSDDDAHSNDAALRISAATVIHRSDDNYPDLIHSISKSLLALMSADQAVLRRRCFRLAHKAEWKRFIKHYYAAFDKAFINATIRNKK
ncbi:MAG: glycosyl transferase [Tannerella sp.]|jgi:glycosyltransferase involved in cell wall biosynthesis|nr:glycosyl transferase [Tannerella sp.]